MLLLLPNKLLLTLLWETAPLLPLLGLLLLLSALRLLLLSALRLCCWARCGCCCWARCGCGC